MQWAIAIAAFLASVLAVLTATLYREAKGKR
jgi:hypothetical protein